MHTHLRLGQMELMRRVSQGRLAEIYDKKSPHILDAGGSLYEFAIEDLARLGEEVLVAALLAALPGATQALSEYCTWCEMHRLPIRHALGAIHLMGRR
ncbi:MAG: hypothetical protein EXQ99_04710 [Alphaproteobacteria bacterium]|nr:hypothetical protein [Alphaproteobacteria bacterium]